MDEGHTYELGEEMPEHPQGRCTMVPLVEGMPNPKWQLGREWFEEQPAATQRDILGKGRYYAWQNGDFDLGQIVTVKPNPIWGPSIAVTPLGQLGARAAVQAPSIDYLAARIEDMRTVDDVAKWAKARYPHINFDFADGHIDPIRPTIKQFDKLAQKYPEVAQGLKYVGTYQGPNAPKIDFNHAIAHATWNGEQIGLNPSYYGDVDYLARTARESFISKWFDADGSPESVMTHEFGHMVENWLLQSDRTFVEWAGSDGLGVVADTVRLFNKKFSPTATLSKYATTTNQVSTASSAFAAERKAEGWAEAFAAIYHKPQKEWPVYVKRINNLLTEIGDPNEWSGLNYVTNIPRDLRQMRQEALDELARLRKKLELE